MDINRQDRMEAMRGFSLVEAIFSLLILMVVLTGAGSLATFSIGYNSGADARAVALALAQQRLERLRNVSFSDSSLSAGISTENNVTSAGRSFRVETRIEDTLVESGRPALKTIVIQVTPLGGSARWERSALTITTRRAALAQGLH